MVDTENDGGRVVQFKLPLSLKIVVNENGSVDVEGPINNLPLCYMMMQLGEDRIKLHQAQQQKVVAAGAEFLKGLPALGKGRM